MRPTKHDKLAFGYIAVNDDVSCSSIINSDDQQGRTNSSLLVFYLFRRMCAMDCIPSAHSFSGIFIAVSNIDDGWAGKNRCIRWRLRLGIVGMSLLECDA